MWIKNDPSEWKTWYLKSIKSWWKSINLLYILYWNSRAFLAALAVLQSIPRAKVKSTIVLAKVNFTSLLEVLRDFSDFYFLASTNRTIPFFLPQTFLPPGTSGPFSESRMPHGHLFSTSSWSWQFSLGLLSNDYSSIKTQSS